MLIISKRCSKSMFYVECNVVYDINTLALPTFILFRYIQKLADKVNSSNINSA